VFLSFKADRASFRELMGRRSGLLMDESRGLFPASPPSSEQLNRPRTGLPVQLCNPSVCVSATARAACSSACPHAKDGGRLARTVNGAAVPSKN
jgi:hypothetical protein